jgi:uncharacterized protein YqcC (DUF446 family)
MIIFLLDELELALKKKQLWLSTPPSVSALASSAPFCCDTMRFEQWLQFVLINKLRILIEQNQPLPANANIAAMAQHVMAEHTEIIELLIKIDTELN